MAGREAFDAMVDAHGRALLRTAYLLTGDAHLAHDLLQTALVKTWTRWPTVRDVDAGPAYVRAVMATTSVAWWRRRWRAEVPTHDVPDRADRDAYAGVEFRDEEAGPAYVRAVMATTSVAWWRRRWRAEVPTYDVPDRPGGDVYAGVESRDEIGRALARLTPRQRAAVVLRYYEDLPESEVAAVLGCSVGTVKSTTSRALATLRAELPIGDPA